MLTIQLADGRSSWDHNKCADLDYSCYGLGY